jgi:predicted DsbA family dithiol-disulfide isomerase
MIRFFRRIGLGAALVAAPLLTLAQGVSGNYSAIGPVPPRKSADVVVVEEFLNFTCPHCNSFREVAKPVFERYGKRVKLVRLPLLFRGQADPPLRLFFVAQANGKEDLIHDVLFDAAFKYNVNIYDSSVVNYLARTNGLAEAYSREGGADWVTRKIAEAAMRANTVGVEVTPTLVIQGAMKMTPQGRMDLFVLEFEGVVRELLR